MLRSFLDEVKDTLGQPRFPRGENLVLMNILDFVLNEDSGFTTTEKDPLTTTFTTTSTCLQCGNVTTQHCTPQMISFTADTFSQSPVDVTDLLKNLFANTRYLSLQLSSA